MSGSSHSNPSLHRVALAIGEGRIEHDVSMRQLAALAGVSRTTIAKIERGARVSPALLVRVAMAMLILDVHKPPPPPLDEDLSGRLLLETPRVILEAPQVAA